jgi:uncharacterized protein (DUF302 family)
MNKMIVALTLLCMPMLSFAVENYAVTFKANGTFSDVRDQLQMAIEGKGLKINSNGKISEMLERTGKDIGATRQIYDHAEQFEFCNAKVSRMTMEADPHAIAMCPYILSVYTIPKDQHVYISYRKPPTTKNPALKKAFLELEKMLTEIIKEAM